MSGWIKIHRSITEHWIYKEKRVFSKFEAWNDILLNVNYSESKTMIKGKIYTVERGQSIMSFESWGRRWNWDKSKVRRFLNLLQSDNMIELKTDTITTQLTVCNFADYQDERNANETRMKHKRNANEIQMKPIKEEKEIKEKKENNIEERKNKFYALLSEFVSEYPKQMLRDFFDYWTEHGEKDAKMRFEKEKTFGVSQRLKTWYKRNPKQYDQSEIVDPLVEYVYSKTGIR